MTATSTEFHAIRNDNGRRTFFSWEGETFFATREALVKAIGEWKKRVTPNMVSRITFEIHEFEAG